LIKFELGVAYSLHTKTAKQYMSREKMEDCPQIGGGLLCCSSLTGYSST